jgi:hypothetical protein
LDNLSATVNPTSDNNVKIPEKPIVSRIKMEAHPGEVWEVKARIRAIAPNRENKTDAIAEIPINFL